ncbi:MAG: trehalose-6-phosphate synthase [Patescibacteria group bacterium]
MTTNQDLKDFFKRRDFKLIMAADAEPRIHQRKNEKMTTIVPAGGVSIALDPIAQISQGVFVARGKTKEDREVVNGSGKIKISGDLGTYALKRVFINEKEQDDYYNGFSNQTLWPLCHVAYERPVFEKGWYENYKKVNQYFAKAITDEVKPGSFIWVNDYQLALVPSLIKKPKDATLAMFWHIPWPTWEIFRTLPEKLEILESLLSCDFLAFHRGYQVRNFLDTVRRELEVRIDEETSRVYYKKRVTTVRNLPMGIDTDVIKSLAKETPPNTFVGNVVRKLIGEKKERSELDKFFEKNKVIVGIDRLDYTKGLEVRLKALDKFFDKYPQYIGKVTYVGIIAPSREKIPSYQQLRAQIKKLAHDINLKHVKRGWLPIHLIYHIFTREDIINFYQKSKICLVTPLDDGMNLVSKEFVMAASREKDPGMVVLSQFAGSAIDLTSALIINPYDIDEVANAIKVGLEMPKQEKIRRMNKMAEALEEKNIYTWTEDFVRAALDASR